MSSPPDSEQDKGGPSAAGGADEERDAKRRKMESSHCQGKPSQHLSAIHRVQQKG